MDGKKAAGLLVARELGPPSSSLSSAALVPGKGKLRTEAIEVRIDPRAEWHQIFEEAWRINRDYFYDPGMHGADWAAMRRKYAAFLPQPGDGAATSIASSAGC